MQKLTNDEYVAEQLIPQMLKELFSRFDFSNVKKDFTHLQDSKGIWISRSDDHGYGTGCASTHYNYVYDGINQPTAHITMCRNPKGDRWLGAFNVTFYTQDRKFEIQYGFQGRDRLGKDLWAWSIEKYYKLNFKHNFLTTSEGPLMDVVMDFVSKIDEAFK